MNSQQLKVKLIAIFRSNAFLIVCVALLILGFLGYINNYVSHSITKFDTDITSQNEMLIAINNNSEEIKNLRTQVEAGVGEISKLKESVCKLQAQVEDLGAKPVVEKDESCK